MENLDTKLLLCEVNYGRPKWKQLIFFRLFFLFSQGLGGETARLSEAV